MTRSLHAALLCTLMSYNVPSWKVIWPFGPRVKFIIYWPTVHFVFVCQSQIRVCRTHSSQGAYLKYHWSKKEETKPQERKFCELILWKCVNEVTYIIKKNLYVCSSEDDKYLSYALSFYNHETHKACRLLFIIRNFKESVPFFVFTVPRFEPDKEEWTRRVIYR